MDLHTYCASTRGGTLHLSPTHHHTVDALATLRELRRSMSKSPSKRHCASRSLASSPRSPLSPSQQRSPLYHAINASECFDENTGVNLRKPRPALRRAAAPHRLGVSLTTPSRTPIRRALSDSSDNGNAGPVQHDQSTPLSHTPKVSPPLPHPHKGTPTMGYFAPPDAAKDAAKALDFSVAKSSPLKRSDGVMNLEKAAFGSPSNKRRSLHGGFYEPTSTETMLDADDDMDDDEDDDDWDDDTPTQEQPFRSSLTSRFSPARKLTSPSRPFLRSHGARNRRSLESNLESPSLSRAPSRTKPRTSLDSNVPTRLFEPQRSDAPRAQAPPNLTIRTQHTRGTRQQPHPLSQAISPTSPTPTRSEHGEQQGPVFESPDTLKINFAKSLPIGALRPDARETKIALNDTLAHDAAFGTPDAFKVAKPDPAGFRSTGLISKRHRDPDDMPPPPDKQMPDTPCKKIPPGFGFSPSPTDDRAISKPRFTQPEFGTPSRTPQVQVSYTPAFPPSQNSDLSGPFANHTANRRTSFASIDGEEPRARSLSERADSQSSADELPPTPTKQPGTQSKPNSLRSSLLGRRPSFGPSTFVSPNGDEAPGEDPPSIFQRSTSGNHLSPHTPLEVSTQVPDPSGLTISPSSKQPKSPSFSSSFGSSLLRAPETPTSHRGLGDSVSFLGTHHLMMTPSNSAANHHDADPVLFARFKKVEWYGRGEFSEVYKVHQSSENMTSYFSPAEGSFVNSFNSQTPMADKVFVVKKSKAPYGSAKLRQKKMREASIMKALGKDDHVVNFIDSWEANNHLYIQTEFCEEGSLATFLEKQGRRGRLDDFRIWKILIELSQGIKHIHDSGFIHLDLKPANVFVDFAGTLKIGDFGLACEWPAPNNIEGEGDRRYIGPDLLQGAFDKPADIFALGMIMFEVASNVDLPDNGESWQQLRSGDWSGLPSLTSGSGSTDGSFHLSQDRMITSGSLQNVSATPDVHHTDIMDQSWRDVSAAPPKGAAVILEDVVQPPTFMIDPEDEGSLDRLVQWMMFPDPHQRPVIDQVLDANGCSWVQERRRSGATVFEGQRNISHPQSYRSRHVLGGIPYWTWSRPLWVRNSLLRNDTTRHDNISGSATVREIFGFGKLGVKRIVHGMGIGWELWSRGAHMFASTVQQLRRYFDFLVEMVSFEEGGPLGLLYG
ncbi:hypothetical protein FH972_023078 [Carpinus fangiana]|uniref:Protein kinase domain-containing protein n=1 Tax=Carpinus fangiana TaxID=176857 RepID=A0A5N6KU41_9ROSI|nr:hypothetical protein FH972_023078 [Carpinus fangiana]